MNTQFIEEQNKLGENYGDQTWMMATAVIVRMADSQHSKK